MYSVVRKYNYKNLTYKNFLYEKDFFSIYRLLKL